MKLIAMVLSLVILAGIQTRAPASGAEYPSMPQGCACHCFPDTVVTSVWQQKHGSPSRFAARMAARWFHSTRTLPVIGPIENSEAFILLGSSQKGVWALEILEIDNGGEVYANLVCVSVNNKRKVFRLITGVTVINRAALASIIARGLRRLERKRQWDPASIVPVQLPLPSKPPKLILREKGQPDDREYLWTLSIRTPDRRLVRITHARPNMAGGYFRGAKCFGGVTDDAKGATWWILVKTAQADSCDATWYSIRFPSSD
ncbi:MAG TPA: hypothetical protein VFV34_23545 [Blastocatellia bacterium]|nr:hypothetical protein [Blastocatellia bacterium]